MVVLDSDCAFSRLALTVKELIPGSESIDVIIHLPLICTHGKRYMCTLAHLSALWRTMSVAAIRGVDTPTLILSYNRM